MYTPSQLIWVYYDEVWWVATVLDPATWAEETGNEPPSAEDLAATVVVQFVEDGSTDFAALENTGLFDTTTGPNDIDPSHENTKTKIAELITTQVETIGESAGDLDTMIAGFSTKYDHLKDEARRMQICTDAIPILTQAEAAVAASFAPAFTATREMCQGSLSATVNRMECLIFSARVARLFVPIARTCEAEWEGSDYTAQTFVDFVNSGLEQVQYFCQKGGSKHMMAMLTSLSEYSLKFRALHKRMTEVIEELQFGEYVPERVSRGPTNAQLLRVHEAEVAQCVKAAARMKATDAIKDTIAKMEENLEATRPQFEAGADETEEEAAAAVEDTSIPSPKAAKEKLPDGWSEAVTEEGDKYYYNVETGEQTWDKDEAFALARAKVIKKSTNEELSKMVMEVTKYPPGKCGVMELPSEPPMTYFDACMGLINERKHRPIALFCLGRTVANSTSTVFLPDNRELNEKMLYKESIRANPQMAWGYIGLGTSMINGEAETLNDGRKFFKKKECFLEAIRCDPRNAFAMNALGVAITPGKMATLHDGRKMDKMDCYMEALRVDPKCARAFYNIGADMINHNSVVTVNGHKLTAKECYIRCVRLDPNNAPAFNNIGNILGKEESFDFIGGRQMDRRACHLEALRIDPEFSYAMFNMACTMEEEEIVSLPDGREMTKRDCFMEVLRIAPDNAKALTKLKAIVPAGESVTLADGTKVDGTKAA